MPTYRSLSVGDYNAFDANDGYVDVLGIIVGNQAPPEQVVDRVVHGDRRRGQSGADVVLARRESAEDATVRVIVAA
jgi:hypothetical protein